MRAGWCRRNGGPRLIRWMWEGFGWLLVSLFIAGMSGVMKKE
jgi:hypothetical protein